MNGDDDSTVHKHSAWVGIWKQAMSFVVGVVVASFFVGGARQRVKDLAAWKEEIAPKIERMDSVGSLSFDHFHKQYEKDQHRIEEHLKQLDTEVKTLQHKIPTME